jgi:hypothetical protein
LNLAALLIARSMSGLDLYQLPDTKPVLDYARELVVYVWSLELAPSLLKHPQVAAVPEPL